MVARYASVQIDGMEPVTKKYFDKTISECGEMIVSEEFPAPSDEEFNVIVSEENGTQWSFKVVRKVSYVACGLRQVGSDD